MKINIKSLLAAGANPNTKDNANWTPLQEVVSYGLPIYVSCSCNVVYHLIYQVPKIEQHCMKLLLTID